MLLRESLEEIDDFRVKRCRKFELADIFLLVLLMCDKEVIEV